MASPTHASGAFTITLNSLANGSARASTSRSPTGHDERVQLELDGNSASNTGAVKVYAGAIVNGSWDAGLTGSDAAFSGDVKNLKLLGAVVMEGTTAFVWSAPVSIAEAFGFLPDQYAIVVENDSGDSLLSSGQAANYESITY